jgi:hypothetical protein
MTNSPSTRETGDTRPIPQTGKMQIPEMRNQVLGSNRRKRSPRNEPKEARECQKLGSTQQPDRNTKVLRIHWILPILCPKLLTNRMTTASSNKEDDPLGMDKNTTLGLRPPKSTNVRSTSPNPTRLRKEVLPPSRCLGVQCGRRTLTRGRNHNPFSSKTTKTSPAPYCVLLGNLHSHGMKL